MDKWITDLLGKISTDNKLSKDMFKDPKVIFSLNLNIPQGIEVKVKENKGSKVDGSFHNNILNISIPKVGAKLALDDLDSVAGGRMLIPVVFNGSNIFFDKSGKETLSTDKNLNMTFYSSNDKAINGGFSIGESENNEPAGGLTWQS